MKEKSDFQKLLEGRCLGLGADYTSWIEASESHTYGYACRTPDPINGRNVNTLSRGEQDFYWLLRVNSNVKEIREQMLVPKEIANKICESHHFRKPTKSLSIDFFVDYKDDRKMAYSVKKNRNDLDPKSARNATERRKIERELEKHIVYQEYASLLGRGFEIWFRDDVDHKIAANIRAIMACYDINTVSETDHMYRYLIAHGYIKVNLANGYIPFAKIAMENKDEIEKFFREVTSRYA